MNDQETEQETKKKTEQNPDLIDDEWETANYADLDCLKRSNEPRLVKIPIDVKNKKYIAFWVQDLTVNDHLDLQENMVSMDRETKQAKMNLKNYYESCYNRMVTKSNPPLEWKQIKRYNAKFFNLVKKIFPDPVSKNDSIGGITREEEGN